MIYRWGMNTFHLSGLGNRPSEIALEQADRALENINNAKGVIVLNPKFMEDYYGQINANSK